MDKIKIVIDTNKMGESVKSLLNESAWEVFGKITDTFIHGLVDLKLEIRDDMICMPRCMFPEKWIRFYQELSKPNNEKEKKSGRKPIKRLFNKIADSKVVGYFKETLSAVKETFEEYYEGIKQFCVCFYNSAFQAFSPKEDPYGKLSHYHRIISKEVEGIPTRKTLSNAYNWFITWKKCQISTLSEQAEETRHKMWALLIKWIYEYLLKLAPQYVVVQR